MADTKYNLVDDERNTVVTNDGATEGSIIVFLDPGHISGLKMSNDADADHDINVTAGIARDDADTENMVLPAEITKQIDAAWAVGDDAGGLDTGSVAEDTYHVFEIKRTDTGVVDILISLSLTSPTMPTNYDKKVYIGSWLTDSSFNIIPGSWHFDDFLFDNPALDVDTTLGTTAALQTLPVPDGIKVMALCNYAWENSGDEGFVYISSPDVDDEAPSKTAAPLSTFKDDAGRQDAAKISTRTNTSSQIRARADVTLEIWRISTLGWNDGLGRKA